MLISLELRVKGWMEDKFIYVILPSYIMSELRELTEESWNDILTIQIEIGRRVVNLGSKESEQTLNHFLNYIWGDKVQIKTFDNIIHDKEELIEKMYDDDFYYGYLGQNALSSSSIKTILKSPKQYLKNLTEGQ